MKYVANHLWLNSKMEYNVYIHHQCSPPDQELIHVVFYMQETFTHFNLAISCIFDSLGTTIIHHNWKASALQRKFSVLFNNCDK